MDKNTVIGLVVIMALVIGWSIYTAPTEEERQAMREYQDSIALVNRALDSIASTEQASTTKAVTRETTVSTPTNATSPASDSAYFVEAQSKYGRFSEAALKQPEYITIENDVFKLKFSTHGGRIVGVTLKDYLTFDSLPLVLLKEQTSHFGFNFFSDNRTISTQDLVFEPVWSSGKYDGRDSVVISGEEQVQLVMRLSPNNAASSQHLDFIYTIKGDDYLLDGRFAFHNIQELIQPSLRDADFIDFFWKNDLYQQEKTSGDNFSGPTVYYKVENEDVENLSERKDDAESVNAGLKWISFKQHFFSSSIIASGKFLNADMKSFVRSGTEPRYLKTMQALIGVPYNTLQPHQEFDFQFYFGPNKYKILKSYDLELEKQIPLGWGFFVMSWINRYAVIPVFNWLESYGMNYGIIILVLTILLKVVLFPIAYKTYTSSAKMRVLKPELDEISAKFPKQEDAMKKQQAMMSLYKKAGINPLAGCIPMLLQLPILLAMFRFFPASIELRQKSFLWADDLSSYDSILELGFNIPFYGDHVSLFTLLMTVSTIFYTRLNNQMMPTSNQMPGMKTMMYLMPIMFLGIFNNYASGLSYYYFLANMLTFGQMYVIRLLIDEDKIHARIKERQAKPQAAKKSAFQRRLEEMAKQRGINPYQYKKK